jgi:hypothetical protein
VREDPRVAMRPREIRLLVLGPLHFAHDLRVNVVLIFFGWLGHSLAENTGGFLVSHSHDYFLSCFLHFWRKKYKIKKKGHERWSSSLAVFRAVCIDPIQHELRFFTLPLVT